MLCRSFYSLDRIVPGTHGSVVPQVLQPGTYCVDRPVPTAVESAD